MAPTSIFHEVRKSQHEIFEYIYSENSLLKINYLIERSVQLQLLNIHLRGIAQTTIKKFEKRVKYKKVQKIRKLKYGGFSANLWKYHNVAER